MFCEGEKEAAGPAPVNLNSLRPSLAVSRALNFDFLHGSLARLSGRVQFWSAIRTVVESIHSGFGGRLDSCRSRCREIV